MKTRSKVSKIDDRIPNPNSIQVLRDNRILRHKKQSERYSGKKFGQYFVKTYENCVHLIDQAGIRSVNYDVSDKHWQEMTGWQN
jgi:hypothetical protein